MTAPDDRASRLVRILADHECWDEVLLPGGKTAENKREFIGIVLDDDPPSWGGLGFQARAAVRAAIREVESGEVFGSWARCCVCGGANPTRWNRVYYHPHYACHFDANPECADAWLKAYEDSSSDNSAFETTRTILRARKILRQRKAKPLPEPSLTTCGICGGDACSDYAPAPFVVDQRVNTTCQKCGATAVYSWTGEAGWWACRKSWTPKPKPNPVREWGMEWPGKAGVLGSPHEYQPETLRRWRERLRAGKIRAEVPTKAKPTTDREILPGSMWVNKHTHGCGRVEKVDAVTYPRFPVVVYRDVHGHSQRWTLCGLPGCPSWRDAWRPLAGPHPENASVRVPPAATDWARRVSFNPHLAQARAVWRDTCARSDCLWRHGNGMACAVCSGWRQRNTWFTATTHAPSWERFVYPVYLCEPVSGNPRGDGFLRDLWREDEKRTEVLRRLDRLESQIGTRASILGGRDAELRAVRELVQRTAADLLEHVSGNHGRSEWRQLDEVLARTVNRVRRLEQGMDPKPKAKPRARKVGKR